MYVYVRGCIDVYIVIQQAENRENLEADELWGIASGLRGFWCGCIFKVYVKIGRRHMHTNHFSNYFILFDIKLWKLLKIVIIIISIIY